MALGPATGSTCEAELKPAVVWVCLGLATAVAAALRLPFLGHQSLWLDEIYTRDIARESTLAGVWRHVRATESTPPLFYVLTWLTGARSAVALRLIPALSLTAAAPVTYPSVRRFIGQRAALVSAALVAVSPMLVSYATDARSYGLLVLTALLTVWAFGEVLDRARTRDYVLWVALAALCVWTHYFGAFLVTGEVLLLLALRPRRRLRTVAASAALALLVAPLVPLVADQSGSERAGFISEIHLGSRVVTTVRQFAMGANVPRTWLEAAGLAIWAMAVAYGSLHALRDGSGPRTLLALGAFTLAIPLALSVTHISDRFYARNVMLVLPLAIAVAAPALLRLRALPLAAYLALATLAAIWVASNWRYEQLDWRDALARAEQIQPTAPVLAVTASSEPVVETYLDRAPAPHGVSTSEVWIVVEPSRPAGHRYLTPSPLPVLAGFVPLRILTAHGFRLALERSPRARTIASSSIAGATLFPG
jgi:mannosyltransferase